MNLLFVITTTILSVVNPVELDEFIEITSLEYGINSSLVKAILKVENPKLNDNLVHVNKNGTADLGLWQLNSKYLWSDFIPECWDKDEVFNPFDWRHSTEVAICHIKWISTKLVTKSQIISAYNCGVSAVKNGRIPESTIAYRKLVLKYYWNIEKGKLSLINNNLDLL